MIWFEISNFLHFAQAFTHAYGPTGKYSFMCEPVDYSDSDEARLVISYNIYTVYDIIY